MHLNQKMTKKCHNFKKIKHNTIITEKPKRHQNKHKYNFFPKPYNYN